MTNSLSRAPLDKDNLIVHLPTDLENLLTQFLQKHITPPIHLDNSALAYRWVTNKNGQGTLKPIDVNLTLNLDDLHGIDTQKQKIVHNTQQFLAGYPANHVLMTGTRGSGKSSLVRALLARFYQEGLRMIEVARDDLHALDDIRQAINSSNHDLSSQPNCRYVIYCDDLAFNAQDENYRTLKSVLDGSLDSEQDNLLVYATSNRRHLLPQLMQDNINIYNGQTDEVNPYETIDETVSLSDRFGLWLAFHPMNQNLYLQIAKHYVQKMGEHWSDDTRSHALLWASSRGGRSGRVAYQFARHWVGKQQLQQNR